MDFQKRDDDMQDAKVHALNDKPVDAAELPPASEEAGDIGDEQCPAGIEKTDKQIWNGSATRAKKESILPKRVREFMNGL